MNGNEKMNRNNYILFHTIQRGQNIQRNNQTEISKRNHVFMYCLFKIYLLSQTV